VAPGKGREEDQRPWRPGMGGRPKIDSDGGGGSTTGWASRAPLVAAPPSAMPGSAAG
jgi:hypothetical protein